MVGVAPLCWWLSGLWCPRCCCYGWGRLGRGHRRVAASGVRRPLPESGVASSSRSSFASCHPPLLLLSRPRLLHCVCGRRGRGRRRTAAASRQGSQGSLQQ